MKHLFMSILYTVIAIFLILLGLILLGIYLNEYIFPLNLIFNVIIGNQIAHNL